MMTEKRYVPHLFDEGDERYFDGIIDNENDYELIRNYKFISDLLNEQSDKIETLEKQIAELGVERDFAISESNDFRLKYDSTKLELDNLKIKTFQILQSFSNRDLSDIERIFLNNICKELGVDLE